jgi:hypothetical protein
VNGLAQNEGLQGHVAQIHFIIASAPSATHHGGRGNLIIFHEIMQPVPNSLKADEEFHSFRHPKRRTGVMTFVVCP